MKATDPLVSVIVVTYNSAMFVEETLASIEAQSYNNIELIITDDGSTDNTVEICRDWLEKKHSRFISSSLVEVVKNTGTPANCNRGLAKANGHWIKFIAGDDILIDEAITDILNETKKFPEDRFFFTQGLTFERINGQEKIYDDLFPELLPAKVITNELDHMAQYKLLLLRQYIFAPSNFFKKDVFDQVGGFDEKYKLLDDYPFFLKCAKEGIRSVYLPVITIKYRSHFDSAFHKDQDKFVVKVRFKKDYDMFLDDHIIPHTTLSHKLGIYWLRFFESICLKLGNRRNLINRIIVNVGRRMNPFMKFYRLKNKINLVRIGSSEIKN